MPPTLLLPAIPPPSDGPETRLSWVKRGELFGADVTWHRAQFLPDAAV
jgi:hypothetical protein